MRHFSHLLIGAVPALLLISACSTVPSTSALTEGIKKDQISEQSQMRVSNDPVCTEFYENVIMAANKSAKAKRTNAKMASTGVSIGTILAGVGPLGSIATRSAASVLINRSVKDVSSTLFDPEQKFDRKVIETADKLQCPVRVKGRTQAP